MPAKLISVQLETNDVNPDGVAFYAYFDGECPSSPGVKALKAASALDGATPLSLEHERRDWEEVPNALSRGAGLRRYYAGSAA